VLAPVLALPPDARRRRHARGGRVGGSTPRLRNPS
jgi:hypothetical protein